MFRRVAKCLVVSALCFSLGLHWALLQGIAWTGMVVSFSREFTLVEAVTKTFDGQHPCKLCKVVNEGKNSEKRQEIEKPTVKLETTLPIAPIVLFHPAFVSPPANFESPPLARCLTPPSPPPKTV